MRSLNADTFEQVVQFATHKLAEAPDVHVGEWQAMRGSIPQAETIEVEDFSFEIPIDRSVEEWQEAVKPNLPWAEEHFQERVSGVPLNPPPSHERWPFAQKNNDEHRINNKFSHTYPERFWPQWAGDGARAQSAMRGIRFDYGDLNDLILLLRTRAGTRQAYLPVWFPEDLYAATLNERVPCTLGYHFLIRDSKLKIVYYIRSCDFYRHFRDDVYMAGRLAQWVADAVGVSVSRLVMHISSLHIFTPERGKVVGESRNYISSNLLRGG